MWLSKGLPSWLPLPYPTPTESIQVPFFFTFKTLGFISLSIPLPNSLFNLSDSCSNTRIEDCYIVSGDDCIAIKSAWDQYGIKFGMRTETLSFVASLASRQILQVSPLAAKCRRNSKRQDRKRDWNQHTVCYQKLLIYSRLYNIVVHHASLVIFILNYLLVNIHWHITFHLYRHNIAYFNYVQDIWHKILNSSSPFMVQALLI